MTALFLASRCEFSGFTDKPVEENGYQDVKCYNTDNLLLLHQVAPSYVVASQRVGATWLFLLVGVSQQGGLNLGERKRVKMDGHSGPEVRRLDRVLGVRTHPFQMLLPQRGLDRRDISHPRACLSTRSQVPTGEGPTEARNLKYGADHLLLRRPCFPGEWSKDWA